jgi:hypothetical protein
MAPPGNCTIQSSVMRSDLRWFGPLGPSRTHSTYMKRTAIRPAAVEVHTFLSVFHDQVIDVETEGNACLEPAHPVGRFSSLSEPL